MTTSDSTSESQLLAADARSLDELFNADPLTLSDDEFRAVIKKLRAARKTWEAEDASSKAQGRRARTSKGAKVTLDTLGLTPEQIADTVSLDDLLDEVN